MSQHREHMSRHPLYMRCGSRFGQVTHQWPLKATPSFQKSPLWQLWGKATDRQILAHGLKAVVLVTLDVPKKRMPQTFMAIGQEWYRGLSRRYRDSCSGASHEGSAPRRWGRMNLGGGANAGPGAAKDIAHKARWLVCLFAGIVNFALDG
jgi:hypothetical protein